MRGIKPFQNAWLDIFLKEKSGHYRVHCSFINEREIYSYQFFLISFILLSNVA